MATTTFHLRTWTRHLVPLEEVWSWKTRFENIQAELKPDAFTLADPGAAERYFDGPWPHETMARLSLGGVLPAMDWPLTVDGLVEGERYTDRTTNRLYRDFVHTHVFERTPDGCRYIDDVVFTPALPTQKLIAVLTQRTFQRRHRVAAAALASDPQATAVSVLRVEDPGA